MGKATFHHKRWYLIDTTHKFDYGWSYVNRFGKFRVYYCILRAKRCVYDTWNIEALLKQTHLPIRS